MNEPERWLRDPTAPKELASLLEVAQAVGPTSAQKAALATQLGAGSGVFWTLPTIMKAILTGGLVLGVGSATYQMGSAPAAATHARPPSGHVARAAEPSYAPPFPMAASSATPNPGSAEPSPVPKASVATAAAPEPQRDDSTRKVPSARASSPRVLAPRQATGHAAPSVVRVDRPSEARLLASARAALTKDPEKALKFVRQHQALYPQGMLAQEREVLKVSALRQAGQDAEAQEAAASFRKTHPDSVHHLER